MEKFCGLVLTFLGLINLMSCDILVKPDWFVSCQLKDAEFVKCSTKSVQLIFDKIIDGNLKITNMSTIDPFYVDKLSVVQSSRDSPVNLDATLTKVKVLGFNKMRIVESQVSKKDYSWLTKVHIPKMRLEGNYNMNGRILLIPLNGRGKCFFEPSNMNIRLYTKTKLYAKHDHTFYNVTTSKVQFTMGGLKLRLDNLFDGAKVLEESTNRFLNENWRDAAEALKPIISKTIEDIMLEILQTIFHQIPADFLVTDLPTPNELRNVN